MNRRLATLVLAGALAVGCTPSGPADERAGAAGVGSATSGSGQDALAPDSRATAGRATTLAPVRDVGVALEESQAPAPGPAGAGQVSWRSTWQLSWAPVPGATAYEVHYGTGEGSGPGAEPDDVRDGPMLSIEVAAGTSPVARLEQDRRAGRLFTSSQLLVAVRAVGPAGQGPRSPWYPVGDVPPDGRPLGVAELGSGG